MPIGSGVDELEVIVAPDTGESLIAVDSTGNGTRHTKRTGKSSGRVKPQLPELSVRLVVNGRAQQRSGAVHTKVADVTFRVSAGVFWQVHSGAAAALAEAVRTVLGAGPGDAVVDLYAGAGLFSVLTARECRTRWFGAGCRARSSSLRRRCVQRTGSPPAPRQAGLHHART